MYVVNIEVISWLVIAEDEENEINTQDWDLDTKQEYWAPFCQRNHSFGWHRLIQRKKTEEGWWSKIYPDVFNQTVFNKLTHSTTRVNDVANKLNDSKAIKEDHWHIEKFSIVQT